MTPFYTDRWLTIYEGHALDVLRKLPSESVHMSVTSPPYWGLRDYGLPQIVFGGDPDCAHEWEGIRPIKRTGGTGERSAIQAAQKGQAAIFEGKESAFCLVCNAWLGQLGQEPTPDLYVDHLVEIFRELRRVLRHDGTFWLNIGDSYASYRDQKQVPQTIERTNAGKNAYATGRPIEDGQAVNRNSDVLRAAGIKHKDMVGIPWMLAFALRRDGWWLRSDVVWAKPNVMPESVVDRPTKSHEYVFLLAKGQSKSRVIALADLSGEILHRHQHVGPKGSPSRAGHEFSIGLASRIANSTKLQQEVGLPPLDSKEWQQRLADYDSSSVGGLPIEHRASVLAARFLGSDISTKEFLGELHGIGIALSDHQHFKIGGTKTEISLPPGITSYGDGSIAIYDSGKISQLDLVHGDIILSEPTTGNYYYDGKAIEEPLVTSDADYLRAGKSVRDNHEFGSVAGRPLGDKSFATVPSGRNKRTVWFIASAPYKGAHYAPFPPKLVEPTILAGTSDRGVCVDCGAPWIRQVDVTRTFESGSGRSGNLPAGKYEDGLQGGGETLDVRRGPVIHSETVGWEPSCAHDHGVEPAVVLDPFGGSGTTAMVAQQLSRRAVLIDLNGNYLKQQLVRNANVPLGL